MRGAAAADRGAMTVAMLGVILVIVLTLAGALVLGAATIAEHRARSAADLASLAAATAREGGPSAALACAWAATVARRTHASLLSCESRPDGSVELRVSCRWPASVPVLGPQTARARSRAGPGL